MSAFLLPAIPVPQKVQRASMSAASFGCTFIIEKICFIVKMERRKNSFIFP
jgi:hypothetical protein